MTRVIEQLSKSLGVSKEEIQGILQNASFKYKVYKIPKRTIGYRVIAQPTKEVKQLQRGFLALHPLPVHKCATAYKTGVGIKENAEIHKKNSYLLKLDFANFFNSIDPNIFWTAWDEHEDLVPKFSMDERGIVQELLFWRPGKKKDGKLILSIGAPSSPAVSNFCLYTFDEKVHQICQSSGVSYTRYADDITLSTNEKMRLFEYPQILRNLLFAKFGNRISLNHSKTIFSSKAHNRFVTGVTLTNDQEISIGRSRKRLIKHLVHQFDLGCLNEEQRVYLAGLLAHAKHIEPKFIASLINKYGQLSIKAVFNQSCLGEE